MGPDGAREIRLICTPALQVPMVAVVTQNGLI
jgi:hypothetical protein